MSTFGKRFKELRKRDNLTQDMAAKIFHVDKSTLSKWENDKNGADNEMLQKIANYFNVSLDYLLGRSNEPHILVNNENKNNKKINEIIDDFETALNNAIMLNGEKMEKKTKKLFKQSLRNVYDFIAPEDKK